MADPRQKWNPNQKWHKHTPTIRPGSPEAYGWQYSHWNEEYRLPVWKIGSVKIMKHPAGCAWVTQEDGSDDAVVWPVVDYSLETITHLLTTDLHGDPIPFDGSPGSSAEPIRECDQYAIEPAF